MITAKAVKQRDMPMDRAFHYSLLPVELGEDEDGDMVTSCVVRPAEALPEVPKLSPQQEIALQALGDALDQEGKEYPTNRLFPPNRRCVSIKCWKEWCRKHELAGGSGGTFDTAFSRAKTALQEGKIIRLVGDYVWRCAE